MQSRQTFMAAMGGVDPGEEAFGEYDEARRGPARPPPSLFVPALLYTHMRAFRRGTSPWTGSRDSSIWARVFVHRLCTPPSYRRAAARERTRFSCMSKYSCNSGLLYRRELLALPPTRRVQPTMVRGDRRPPARGAPAQSLHPALAGCVHYRAAHVCTHMPCYCAVP